MGLAAEDGLGDINAQKRLVEHKKSEGGATLDTAEKTST